MMYSLAKPTMRRPRSTVTWPRNWGVMVEPERGELEQRGALEGGMGGDEQAAGLQGFERPKGDQFQALRVPATHGGRHFSSPRSAGILRALEDEHTLSVARVDA
ncbi:hypothetical protein VTK73DRAFT_3148 [Phialemonium thermophilum]|uniref:Uncharacterized protein n=1 Tax=Phialemonium thermophilum TaxID=223376 RepID=A0ABR3VLG5_9PEZI